MSSAAEAAAIDRMRASTIKGPTILLRSGTYLDLLQPEHAEPTIEDIAYGLAYTCRFAGQTRRFYSVAEHCVRMSRVVPTELRYPALHHEDGEAFVGDMTGPLKALLPAYREIEKRIERAMHVRFAVPPFDAVALKRWDLAMLAAERRDLMPWRGEQWSWLDGIEPVEERIEPWGPEKAAATFIARHAELCPHG